MAYDNVQLWFAKDENGKIVTIDEVNKNTKNKYFCPICGSEVLSRQGEINSWCFAHVDKSKCNGETRIHWWIKNKLIEKGSSFIIKTDKEKEYICKNLLIEQSYEINGNIYKPDLTIVTETGETIYFEIEHTNKKKSDDYMSIWIDLNNIIVEVSTKELINSNKNELPVFKALFYNGRCREVKKNNIYYNTIGKYKEGLFKNGTYESRKEEVKRLDWFWRDVAKYKNNEVNIEYMVNLIDSISNKDDRKVVDEILSKPRCSNLSSNYMDKKSELVLNEIRNNLKELITDKYEIALGNTYKSIFNYDKRLRKNIKFYDIQDDNIYGYDITEKCIEEIILSLKKDIENITIREKYKKDLEYAKQNVNIGNASKKIINELKKIDSRYGFQNECGFDKTIRLHYQCNYKMNKKIDDNIIYCEDENYIYNYFINEVKSYLDKITPFEKLDNLIDLCKRLDIHYNNITIKKYREVRNKIGKRRYNTYNLEEKFIYGVIYKIISQNCIRLNIYQQHVNFNYEGYKHDINNNSYIYIFNDGVYVNDKYVNDSDIEILDYKNILRVIDIFNVEDDINRLERVLKELISSQIRKDRYGTSDEEELNV